MKDILYITISLFCFSNLFCQKSSLKSIYLKLNESAIDINIEKYDKIISNSNIRFFNILANEDIIVYYPLSETSLIEDIIGDKWTDVPAFYIYSIKEDKYILVLFDEGQVTYRKSEKEYSLYFNLNVQYAFLNYYVFNNSFNLTHIIKVPVRTKTVNDLKDNRCVTVYDINNKRKYNVEEKQQFTDVKLDSIFSYQSYYNSDEIKKIDQIEVKNNIDMLPNWIPIKYIW